MKYTINIDDGLWKSFKLLCVMNQITMKDKITAIIREEITKVQRKYSPSTTTTKGSEK
jgi:hypothetical protein